MFSSNNGFLVHIPTRISVHRTLIFVLASAYSTLYSLISLLKKNPKVTAHVPKRQRIWGVYVHFQPFRSGKPMDLYCINKPSRHFQYWLNDLVQRKSIAQVDWKSSAKPNFGTTIIDQDFLEDSELLGTLRLTPLPPLTTTLVGHYFILHSLFKPVKNSGGYIKNSQEMASLQRKNVRLFVCLNFCRLFRILYGWMCTFRVGYLFRH